MKCFPGITLKNKTPRTFELHREAWRGLTWQSYVDFSFQQTNMAKNLFRTSRVLYLRRFIKTRKLAIA